MGSEAPDQGVASRSGRRWPRWVAVGLVAVMAVLAVMATLGAWQADRAADDAEAEVAASQRSRGSQDTDLREARRELRAARRDVAALEGLFVPGMAGTLQGAFVLVAAEVCRSAAPVDPASVEAAAQRVSDQVPALAGHEGWAAAIDPAAIAERCDSNG